MGRAAEFSEGLRAHEYGLRAYCARLLWCRDDLEDVLQETLMVAFRQFDPANAVMGAARLDLPHRDAHLLQLQPSPCGLAETESPR